jgi:glyoxylase-like metal-dependent hydrolase (beta-lactamase superfamily II)
MKIKTLISGKLDNNTYILCNDQNEAILIDAAAELEDIIARTEDYKVLGVILTHGHYDHFVNLDKIVKHFDIKCFITQPELEKLYNPKANYSIVFNQIKTSRLTEDNFKILTENDEFELGSFEIKTFVTTGHTNGSICIEIEKTLFTGDTKFARTYGRTDLITGSEEEMQQTLDFLDKKYKGWEIYPGHGKPGKI